MKGGIKNSIIREIIRLSEKFSLFKRNSKPLEGRRFLVVSTTGIGDTLWGTPAIRALREAFHDAYICVLTNPAGLDTLRGNPDIDNILTFRQGTLGYLSCISLLKKLRKMHIDTAFIFHASDRIIWPLSYFSGASEIIGFRGESKGLDFILTKAVEPQSGIHGVESRLRLVKESGASTLNKAISVSLSSPDREAAGRALKGYGIREDSLIIGLHPGAQKPFKCWPEKKFIETGQVLKGAYNNCKVVITGDKNERALAERIAAGIGGAIILAGRLSLRETAAVIERMDLFITNDTGPMHIALALNTPVVALFAPTDPILCGPYHAGNAIVIKKQLTCDPCTGKRCVNPLCMDQITTGEVTAAADSLIPAHHKLQYKAGTD